MKVNAMATIGTVNVTVLHVLFLSTLKLFHTSILPRVFSSIEEINILLLDAGSIIHFINLFPCRAWHSLTEDSLAVISPIGKVQSLRSHGMGRMRNLKKSKL